LIEGGLTAAKVSAPIESGGGIRVRREHPCAQQPGRSPGTFPDPHCPSDCTTGRCKREDDRDVGAA